MAPAGPRGGGGGRGAAAAAATSASSSAGAGGLALPTLVLDNGADRLKGGWSGDPEPRVRVPNCTAKLKGQVHWLVADELEQVNNTANLTYTRPFDRGYLNDWQSEHQVWRRVLGPEGLLKADPKESRLLLTEAPFTPSVLGGYTTQVVFEEFGFAACAKLPAASLSAHRYGLLASSAGQQQQQQQQPQQLPECVLVVDSGFSFTHVLPYYRGRVVRAGVRRVNVGGKLLTNFLKETVSYRQWNMMDEFQLMNDAKEALCYISQDFAAEMAKLKPGGGPSRKAREEAGWEPIKRNFVLPDFQTTMRGFVQEPGQALASEEQQVLAMEVERFVVPEVLFRPSDIGLRQAGLPEAILQAVQACDVGLQGPLYANILLTGGNVLLPGLGARLEAELRSRVPAHHPVRVTTPPDPIDYAWKGGAGMGQQQRQGQGAGAGGLFVTKQQYEEYGADACQERFFDALW